MATAIKTAKQQNANNVRPAPTWKPTPRRFTVEEVYKMTEAGILPEDERIELIEGEIIVMGKQGPQHASCSSRISDLLRQLLGQRALVRFQLPVRLSDSSEPEPDIAVVLPDEDYYSDHHPTPSETLLVLEVSDTTLRLDRVRKSRVYAEAGIPQYCILNLKARELEDQRQPSPNGYRSKRVYTEDESFTLAAFPDILLKVRDLLPSLKATLHKRRKK
jgi:Uma2 family endonuclease